MVVCAGCGKESEEKILYLHPRCHMSSPTVIKYDVENEKLIVECFECGQEIVTFRFRESENIIPKRLD